MLAGGDEVGGRPGEGRPRDLGRARRAVDRQEGLRPLAIAALQIALAAVAGAAEFRAELRVEVDKPTVELSPHLYGLFFEDINYAADGGLYAELVRNRSFEFDPQLSGWSVLTGATGAAKVSVQTDRPLNEHNPQYVRLDVTAAGAGLANSGFDGIALQKDARYVASFYARSATPLSGPIAVQLLGASREVLGTCEVKGLSDQWQKFSCTVSSTATTPLGAATSPAR